MLFNKLGVLNCASPLYFHGRYEVPYQPNSTQLNPTNNPTQPNPTQLNSVADPRHESTHANTSLYARMRP